MSCPHNQILRDKCLKGAVDFLDYSSQRLMSICPSFVQS